MIEGGGEQGNQSNVLSDQVNREQEKTVQASRRQTVSVREWKLERSGGGKKKN